MNNSDNILNITVLFGSPHPHGNTDKLLKVFLDAIPQKKSITQYSAYSLGAKPCLGCMKCREDGHCVYSDLDPFFASVLSCDLLVIAVPQYFRGMPAPVKAIIDRTQRFFGRTAKSKTPCALLICGGAEHADARIINAELYYALPCLGAQLACTVVAADTDRAGISHESIEAARNAAVLVYEQYITT